MSSSSNNQTGHLAGLNRQRDRQAKIDAETRIRVVLGQHDANLDEVMIAEPNSKAVQDWRKLLRSQMLGEWTAVYQKAWEKCRRAGRDVWHERNPPMVEMEDRGDIQINNFQSADMEVVPGVVDWMSDSTDFGESDVEVEVELEAPRENPHSEVRETPSISELVSIVDVLTRGSTDCGWKGLRSSVLEKALRALEACL